MNRMIAVVFFVGALMTMFATDPARALSPQAAQGSATAAADVVPAPTATSPSVAAQPSSASTGMCGGPIVLADNFKRMDRAWGKRDAYAFVTPNNAFGLAATPGDLNLRLNLTSRYADVDVCANVFAAQTHDPSDYGGIIFWAQNEGAFYFAFITDDGRFGVQHFENGKRDPRLLIEMTPTAALKTGTTVPNALEVSLSGATATIVINGQEVAQFTGTPPAQGGYIGFGAAAQAAGVTDWGFYHLVVAGSTSSSPSRVVATNLPPVNKPSPCTGTPLLSDDFATLDPAWQPVDRYGAIDHGGYDLSALRQQISGRFDTKGSFTDFDACASVLAASEADKAGSAGLIFWAKDASHFDVLAVTGQGNYGVFQYAGDTIMALVPWTRADTFAASGHFWNELDVHTQGSKITVAINGNVLTSVDGTPPPAGGYVGFLVAAPPNDLTTWTFVELRVTSAEQATQATNSPQPQPAAAPAAVPAGTPGPAHTAISAANSGGPTSRRR